METIDLETWDRKALFNNYFGTDFPYIILGANIDVTNLYNYTKQNGISFYFGMVYAANEIANRIKNFRYRFTDGKPYLIDSNQAILTHMQPGSESFVLIETEPANTMIDFCRQTANKAAQKFEDHGWGGLRNQADAIIYSVIPWVQFTFLVRTVAKGGIDCAPRIAWGKYAKTDGRLMMPLSLQVHHGLMDGYHVGMYFQKLQEYLDNQGWL